MAGRQKGRQAGWQVRYRGPLPHLQRWRWQNHSVDQYPLDGPRGRGCGQELGLCIIVRQEGSNVLIGNRRKESLFHV